MIQNPKNLTEQLLNLCERLAVEMRALFNTVDTKLGKTEKATSAKTADTATASVTATKATQDASGNIITSTYATKAEMTQGLAGKANSSHTHTIANVTGLQNALDGKQAKGDYATNTALTQGLAGKANSSHTHTKAQITDFPSIPDASTLIPKSGNRGALKGFENSTAGTTVNDTSPDTQHTGSNVTVQNGTTNATISWTKVVDMTAGTVTLGSSWVWSGGKAPTLKYPGVLTCHWNGGNRKGIAIYTAGAS